MPATSKAKKASKSSPPPLQLQDSDASMGPNDPIHQSPADPDTGKQTTLIEKESLAAAFARYASLHATQPEPYPVTAPSFDHFTHLHDEAMASKIRETTSHFNKPFRPEEFNQMVSFDNIKAPTLTKPDLMEMKSFWQKYVKYRKELDDKFPMFGGNVAIQFKSVRQCMDEYTFESLCRYRWNKEPSTITDDEVIRLFKTDCLGSKLDIKLFLDRINKELKMDKSVVDGPSRILCLVRLYDKICTGFPKYYEIEVKTARHHFLNALEPINVRKKILAELKFSKRRYTVWKDFTDTKPDAKEDKTPRQNEDKKARSPNDSREQHSTNAAKPQALGKEVKAKYSCLKCKSSEHNIWKCPQLSNDDEAKTLLKAYYDQKRAEAAGKTPTISSLTSSSVEETIYGVCCGLDLKILFDFGSDVCVISQQFVDRARLAGCPLRRRSLPSSTTALAFNGSPVKFQSAVTLDMSVPTESGPIVLRHLNCWIQNTPLPLDCADLLVSKTIMTSLGFDQAAFLRNARNIRPIWDFEPTLDISTSSTMIGALVVNRPFDAIHD
ncbi:hypothetical protein Ae201684P_017962 [Aphanomyces euteiches]|nr:hypothetical protein Ae201684P_017962 [Aphanomyces euteiches]